MTAIFLTRDYLGREYYVEQVIDSLLPRTVTDTFDGDTIVSPEDDLEYARRLL